MRHSKEFTTGTEGVEIPPGVPVAATTLFSDDFENGLLPSLYSSFRLGGNSTFPAISSTRYAYGSKSLFVSAVGAINGSYVFPLTVQGRNYTTLHVRCYMYLETWTPPYAANGFIPFFINYTAAAGYVGMRLDNTRNIVLVYNDAGVDLTDTSATVFPLNAWHCLELAVDSVNYNRQNLRIYYDGTELTDVTHLNTLPPGPWLVTNPGFGIILLSNTTAAYIDALAISEGYIGPVPLNKIIYPQQSSVDEVSIAAGTRVRTLHHCTPMSPAIIS